MFSGSFLQAQKMLLLSLLITPIIPFWPSPLSARIQGVEVVGGTTRNVGELIEVAVTLDRTYSNPFDPDVVDVTAQVTGPDGAFEIPAFWFQDYVATAEPEGERLTPTGSPHFRLRFRPEKAGEVTMVVRATDSDGSDLSGPIKVAVGPGVFKGFVRRVPGTPLMAWSSGEPYVPFGMNVDWVGKGGTGEYAYYFGKMATSGLNWSRVWMTHFDGTALEWSKGDDGGYCGLSCYNLKAAWRLDRILDLAAQNGVAVQLVLQQHSQFEASMWSSWADNPWNAANGGPLQKSADFFTHPETVKGFDKKLRYIVARYAHSPGLLAFELWNEMDLILGADREAVHAWCRERVKVLRAMDIFGHMVTTSYAVPGTADAQQDWGFEGYDLVQLHTYVPLYWETLELSAPYLTAFGKPVIVGEFGIDFLGEQNQKDTLGIHLHNANVLAFLLGFSGGAMSWWWDNYIEKLDLWGAIAGPAKALRATGVTHAGPAIEGAKVDQEGLVVKAGAAGAEGVLVLVHDTDSEWDKADLAPKAFEGVRLTVPLPCPKADAYFFDTWTGKAVGHGVGVGPAEGILLPAFRRDILVHLVCTEGPEPSHGEVQEEGAMGDGPEGQLELGPGGDGPEGQPEPRQSHGGCSAPRLR